VIGAAESGERMRELNLAYEVLKDPSLRAQYDSESQSSDGLYGDLESMVKVWVDESTMTDLPQQKVAALNREMALMEQEGWKVERVHDHLVCTRTDRKGRFGRGRKRRVTVNIDRNGRAFRVEQMRPD
jgi:curved DNA-binding protein CbpA